MHAHGRRCGRLAILAAVATAAASPALAEEKVAVQIWAIRATKSNSDISPELKSFAEKLKKDFKFTGYKLEKKAGGSVEIGKTFKTRLIGQYSAEVTPSAKKGNTVTLKLRILERQGDKQVPKVSTTLTLSGGKFQLVGGPSLGGGDVLIVAVSAR